MLFDSVSRYHYILGDVLFVLRQSFFNSVLCADCRLRVAYSCGKAQYNGSIELFGYLVCELCVILTLLRVGRFKHGNFSGYGIVA